MPDIPQPPRVPQPPKVPPPPKIPGAPKLPGGFKFGRKKEAAPAEAEQQQAQQPAGPVPYETWVWPAAEQEQEFEMKPSRGPLIAVLALILLLIAGGVAAFLILHDSGSKKHKAAAPTKATPTAPPPVTNKAAPLKSWVVSVESILRASSTNRAKLVSALGGVENGCATKPDAAAGDVSAVANGRQALLAQVGKLKPPNAAAARATALLKQSLTASLAANKSYEAWLADIKNASPCPGSTSSNAHFAAAGRSSAQATQAKAAFAQVFNPLASKVGQPTWSPDKI